MTKTKIKTTHTYIKITWHNKTTNISLFCFQIFNQNAKIWWNIPITPTNVGFLIKCTHYLFRFIQKENWKKMRDIKTRQYYLLTRRSLPTSSIGRLMQLLKQDGIPNRVYSGGSFTPILLVLSFDNRPPVHWNTKLRR